MKEVKHYRVDGIIIETTVTQKSSKYNPTLYFGPCSVTLHELFSQGYFLFASERKAKYLKPTSWSSNLYLSNGFVRYKISKLSINELFHKENDLGKYVKRVKGSVENKGSTDYKSYIRSIDILKTEREDLNEKLIQILGDKIVRREVDSDTFRVKGKVDYKLVYKEIKSLVEFNKGQTAVFKKASDEIRKWKSEYTEHENLKDTVKALELECRRSPFDKIAELYPRKRKNHKIVIGNYTLKQYIEAELEKIAA